MSTVQEAAISYFGLPEGTTLVEGGPVGAFAFIIPLTEEHLRGIADRMKAMAEPLQPATINSPAQAYAMKTRDELRNEWQNMSSASRARFGSFGRYAAHSAMGMAADDGVEIPHSEGAGGRKVQHVDAPVEEESGLPDAVWIPAGEATEAQKYYRVDTDPIKGFLVSNPMLTDEQRAKYVKGGA